LILYFGSWRLLLIRSKSGWKPGNIVGGTAKSNSTSSGPGARCPSSSPA